MTYLEQAIRDAVEGGWTLDMTMNWYATTSQEREQLRMARIDRAILDPLFWQALGKARGWRDENAKCNNNGCREGLHSTRCPRDDGALDWKDYWHRLIDHLASGKDIESFFKELSGNE